MEIEKPVGLDNTKMMTEASSSTTKKKVAMNEFSLDYLRVYYQKLFPYEAMFDWLSYGQHPDGDSTGLDGAKMKKKRRKKKKSGDKKARTFFLRREFSFTLANDVYTRYLSFKDAADFRKNVLNRQPHKIDIGPVYSFPCVDREKVKKGAFVPEERELVFDIDLTDYEGIGRMLEDSQDIWNHSAWALMACACRVIDYSLREDFGFKHLLWVFSGRRGIHCWVCDPAARALTDEARSAIAEYLAVVHANQKQTLKEQVRTGNMLPLHPLLTKVYSDFLVPVFEKSVASDSGLAIFSEPRHWETVLKHLPNKEMREALHSEWQRQIETGEGSGLDRWNQLLLSVNKAADSFMKKRQVREATELKLFLKRTVFLNTYARIDIGVSKHRNHLLKSPFVAHPKTGKICVIFDPKKVEDFDPNGVPTVRSVANELDHGSREIMRRRMKPTWEMKTRTLRMVDLRANERR